MVWVRGVVKLQLLAARPTVPEVTGALVVEVGGSEVESEDWRGRSGSASAGDSAAFVGVGVGVESADEDLFS